MSVAALLAIITNTVTPCVELWLRLIALHELQVQVSKRELRRVVASLIGLRDSAARVIFLYIGRILRVVCPTENVIGRHRYLQVVIVCTHLA